MLTQLLPDQIAKFWDIIKFGIEESLPPMVSDHPERMNNVLASLLSGKAQCWVSHRNTEEGKVFEGVVITKVMVDDITATKNLLIYSVYGYTETNAETWQQGFMAIAKYAISKGCQCIVGYTDIPDIIKIVKKFNGEARYAFIKIPLK